MSLAADTRRVRRVMTRVISADDKQEELDQLSPVLCNIVDDDRKVAALR